MPVRPGDRFFPTRGPRFSDGDLHFISGVGWCKLTGRSERFGDGERFEYELVAWSLACLIRQAREGRS